MKLLLVEDSRLSRVSNPNIARIIPRISNLRSREMPLQRVCPKEGPCDGVARDFDLERDVFLLLDLEVDFLDDFVDLRAAIK